MQEAIGRTRGASTVRSSAERRSLLTASLAISTVLAHPTKKANPLRSSRKPLPPLAPAPGPLPKPPPAAHYDAYLQSITPLWDSFASAQASSSTSGLKTTPQVELPSLDSVPELFFDSSFDLSDPATWAAVVGASSSLDAISPKVQDALSSNLDHLERHLVHEISLRSTAFFSALSNLQDLHSESASCLERIASLRSALRDVGQNQANKGLDIIAAQAKLADLRQVEQVLRDVGILEDTLETAEGFVQEGDWTGAVVCLEDIGRWWERHSQGDQPLTSLPALEHYPSTVRHLCKALAGQLESALGSMLAATLGADVEAYDSQSFKRNVTQLVAGLARCEASHAVETVWREAALTAVRQSSRQVRVLVFIHLVSRLTQCSTCQRAATRTPNSIHPKAKGKPTRSCRELTRTDKILQTPSDNSIIPTLWLSHAQCTMRCSRA
jgi:vacuolar protein sorting-associated protein 54